MQSLHCAAIAIKNVEKRTAIAPARKIILADEPKTGSYIVDKVCIISDPSGTKPVRPKIAAPNK